MFPLNSLIIGNYSGGPANIAVSAGENAQGKLQEALKQVSHE
jgi:N-acetylglucosamine kinase-like BadF-type ATPase